jgi:hypothetical protein
VPHRDSSTYKPVAIGGLTGQIGVVSLANSPNTLLVAVVSNGQHQVIPETLVKPNTLAVDLLEADMAIGALHQTSSYALRDPCLMQISLTPACGGCQRDSFVNCVAARAE